MTIQHTYHVFGVIIVLNVFLYSYYLYSNYCQALKNKIKLVMKKLKNARMIMWSLFIIVVCFILGANSEVFSRIISCVFSESLYTEGLEIYTLEDIVNIESTIKTFALGIIALFIPAIFGLYISFKRDIFQGLYSIWVLKHDDKITYLSSQKYSCIKKKITSYTKEYSLAERSLKFLLRILFGILLFVLISISVFVDVQPLDFKGDIYIVLQSLIYITFIGFTLLLVFYYLIAIPFYKEIFDFNITLNSSK